MVRVSRLTDHSLTLSLAISGTSLSQSLCYLCCTLSPPIDGVLPLVIVLHWQSPESCTLSLCDAWVSLSCDYLPPTCTSTTSGMGPITTTARRTCLRKQTKKKEHESNIADKSLKNQPLAQPSMANSVGASINTNQVDGIGAMPLGEVSPFGEPGGAEEVAGAVCRGRAYRFLSRGCPSTV